MRLLLLIFTLLSSASFIVLFNVMGKSWDMSGYNEALDLPAGEAFEAPKVRIGSQSPALFMEGKEMTLSASASGGGLSFQWYYNDKPIQGAMNNVLLIHGVQTYMAGTYSIVVKNKFGESKKSIDVSVLPKTLNVGKKLPPQVHYITRGGKATLGRSFSLSATVSGDRSFYSWKKNGQLIVNATSERLFFEKVKRTDTGVYTVTIGNEYGRVTHNMVLRAVREVDNYDSI